MENLKFHGVCVELEIKICFLRQSWKNIVDKFTKVSKIDICLECFTVYFSQSSNAPVGNLAFGWQAGDLPSVPNFSGIFLKFPNFLGS